MPRLRPTTLASHNPAQPPRWGVFPLTPDEYARLVAACTPKDDDDAPNP
jgi:hypothetical protein